MLKFDSTLNFVKQEFSFSSPIIRYLMLNADSENLKKLYKTCKYFYSRLQINIVDDLCLDNEELLTTDDPEAYNIFLHYHQLDKLPNNLWLTGSLLLGDNLNISKFFSKIFKCNLYTLDLYVTTKFTMNDFEILTRSGTIKIINMDTVIYLSHDNETIAPLEDILSCVLSAHSISFYFCYATKTTMKKLMQLKGASQHKHFNYRDFGTFTIPMSDCVLVGSLKQPNRSDLAITDLDRDDIWKRYLKLHPSLKGAKVIAEWSGLRPDRPSIRMEKALKKDKNDKSFLLIHNYGHGGNGFTVGWGCALQVVEYIEEFFNLKSKM